MKSVVVPAQITTVEDRIIGNFTFVQILLLMVPLISGTLTYALLSPKLHLTAFKLILIISQIIIFGVLALRIRSKTILEWLFVYLKYSLRPKLYIFTKNDLSSREVLAQLPKEVLAKAETERVKPKVAKGVLSVAEQLHLNKILTNPNLKLRFERAEKGGLSVTLSES